VCALKRKQLEQSTVQLVDVESMSGPLHVLSSKGHRLGWGWLPWCLALCWEYVVVCRLPSWRRILPTL